VIILRKAYENTFKVIEAICIIFLAVMIMTMAYMVIMRYIFSNSPRWGDEIALFCMVWIGLLSSSIAMKEDLHIRIKLWDLVLSPKSMKILEIIVHIIVCIVLATLLIFGYKLFLMAGKTTLTGSGIPLKFLHLSVPVSAFFMLLGAIGRMCEIIGNKR
jgi:TRAP-type C4-dicarboxylate transport system permease small subunit